MLRNIAILLTCIAAMPCAADDPLIQWPSKAGPAPEANFVDTLKVDSWLVVESSAELILRRYPEGKISVVEVTTRGGDRLYFLRGVSPGVVCVDLIPVGLKTENSIARHVVTVVDGTNPNPPPKPDPGPGPTPQPTAKTVSIAIVEDTMNRSPDMAILMNQLVAWAAFTDAGNDWRAYDLATTELRGMASVSTLNGIFPGIVVCDKATKKLIHSGPMPATIDELKALVRRLTSG